jgi:hypothetical protein
LTFHREKALKPDVSYKNPTGGTPMKWMRLAIRAVAIFALAFALVPQKVVAQATNTAFYVEVAKPEQNRIYVFNDPKAYQEFLDTGDIEKKITRIGEGPNGETMVFDSENAIHLYNFKHDRPAEIIVKTEPPPVPMQEKLPYKFSGYMFGDYFYNVQANPDQDLILNRAINGPEDFNAFVFRRIYFTFDDQISEKFSSRFRLEADNASLNTDLKISVFVKDAWLKWKDLYTNGDLWIGIQPTPAFEIEENLWAYRSLEKTIMDLRGIVPSRDFGASLRGRFGLEGKNNYWLMVGNNSGNRIELDKYKRFYFQYWLNLSKLTITAYYDYRQNPPFIDTPPDPGIPPTERDANINLGAFFVGYGVKDKYEVGLSTFYQRQENGQTVNGLHLKERNTIGTSIWGWANFNEKFGVVGRYDFFDPNTDNLVKNDYRNYWLFSFVYKPIKNVWIMPNVVAEQYQNLPEGIDLKTAIQPRITFYWIFLS